MGEARKIGGRHLAAAIAGNVDAVGAGDRLGAPVGRLADVPVAGAGGVDLDVEADPLRLMAERRLGERRTADVAEADEQDGGFHAARSILLRHSGARAKAREPGIHMPGAAAYGFRVRASRAPRNDRVDFIEPDLTPSAPARDRR